MQKSKGKTALSAVFLSFCVFGFADLPSLFAAVKDQSRITTQPDDQKPPQKSTPLVPDNLLDNKPIEPEIVSPQHEEEEIPAVPYEIDNIPALTQIKLTIDLAKRALDAFAEVGRKYDDKGLNDYPTLEEFVEKTDAGKQLESDVKKFGFKNISEWNTAIMNVSFAYGALNENQEQDIRHQIETVKKDTSLSDEKKQRIIASLNALIQPKENVEIIKELQKLPVYTKKLNLLNAFE